MLSLSALLTVVSILSHVSAAGRSKFLDEVYTWVDEYGNHICEQLRRLGSSVDWDRKAFTMDAVRSVRAEAASCINWFSIVTLCI